jgi:hyperosmotically inducible protein
VRSQAFKLAAVVSILAAMAMVAACKTTSSPGTQIDDNAIHAQVKAKLTGEHFSNITNIDVNVTNGVVTLAGEVSSEKIKAEAEAEARSVKGVKSVRNNLQVSPKNS